MQKFLVGAFVALLLTGCLSRLENSTDLTKAEVEKTNKNLGISNAGILETADILRGLEKQQTYATALAGMMNKEYPDSVRSAFGALTIFKADIEELGQIIGAPFALTYPEDRDVVGKPNVVRISLKTGGDVNLAAGPTLDVNTWKILLWGCEAAALSLESDLMATPGPSATELAELHEKGMNYFLACTAIGGGRPAKGSEWKPSADKNKDEITKHRTNIETQVRKLSAMSSVFTDEDRRLVASLLELRYRGSFEE